MRGDERRSRSYAKSMRREMTKAEMALWSALREANRHGFKFRRQHVIGDYIADFAHIRGMLVIEIDGETHGTDEEREYDARRTAWLKARGWAVVRFTNDDIYENCSGVVEILTARLGPHPKFAAQISTSPAERER